MAASFTLRTDRTAGYATLYVRIQSRSPKTNIRLSTELEVDIAEWNKSLTNVKTLKTFREGKGRELYSKLDALSDMIDSLIKSGVPISSDMLKPRIHAIVYSEQISVERTRKEEEERKAKEITFCDFVERFIEEHEQGLRKKQGSNANLKAGTVKSYRGFLTQLREYEKARFRVIGFGDIDILLYDDFKAFLSDKDYSANTIGRMVKILKTVCNAAEQLKLLKAGSTKGFAGIHKEVDAIYLSERRLQELIDADLSNTPTLDKARDIFVVGCLTGQRISDYKRIGEDMITTLEDGKEYLRICQQKTDAEVFIPVDDRLRPILCKYDGVLPCVPDQKLNQRIKEIGKLLGWTETISITEYRGGDKVIVEKSFHDLIKTHTARRTFATLAYQRGVSLSAIMAITGHSSEKMLRTYLKLDSKERAMMAARELSGK